MLFLDKVVLTKIEYKDIYGEEHVKYYIDESPVTKEKYEYIVSQGYVFDSSDNYINRITFQAMRQILEEKIEEKNKKTLLIKRYR